MLRGHHETLEFRRAAADTRAIWVRANTYLQEVAPWSLLKVDPGRAAFSIQFALRLVQLSAHLAWGASTRVYGRCQPYCKYTCRFMLKRIPNGNTGTGEMPVRLPYHVKLDSFREGFPDGIEVPPLLEAFASWLKDVPYGGVGCFELLGEPLDVTYVSDEDEAATERLRRQLGIFLHLGEGSRLALWYYGAVPPAVVLLGSEGDLENVAPSLEAFLAALSEGRTGVGLGLDSGCDESKRPDLRAWLAQQGIQAPALAEPISACGSKPQPDGCQTWWIAPPGLIQTQRSRATT